MEYEVDQRHAEIILAELGLGMGSKSVTTPGVHMKKEEIVEEVELVGKQRSQYRGMVARANYLAQDRCDIQFAVKVLSRGMAKPTTGNWQALKRLGRYLLERTRCVLVFARQGTVQEICTQSDTHYAGCLRTWASMSGGVINMGKYVIRS
jgi:hypothetical protein